MGSTTDIIEATLCFLVRGDEVLLAKKLRKIGMGKWNGYGGGIESGENEVDAVIREFFEESGGLLVMREGLEKAAIVDFHNTNENGGVFLVRVHIYTALLWTGEPKDSSEMAHARWFSKDNLPLEDMMPADSEWLPTVLAGKKIKATYYYGPQQAILLKPSEIVEVESFPHCP